MLGYHDSNRCATDLWSPMRQSAAENRAFSAYAYHTQQLDDIVASIAAGEENLSVSDDLTSDDLRYIEDQLRARYGMDVEISF